MTKLVSAEYVSLLSEVKERVRRAQYAALRSVNRELIALYGDIGRMIVGRQVNDSWGKAVVERLAADLQAEFSSVGGFSPSNLWRMKGFYEAYASSEKLALLVREIAWSHNHWGGNLPHRQAPTKGTEGRASRTQTDCEATGEGGMIRQKRSEAAFIGDIIEKNLFAHFASWCEEGLAMTFRLAGLDEIKHRIQRDLRTAKADLPIDEEWAYTIAYHAMLRAGRALIFASGYRPKGFARGASYAKMLDP